MTATIDDTARERLLDAVADLVVRLDEDGTVLAADGSVTELLGEDSSAVVGTPIAALLADPIGPTDEFDATAATPEPLFSESTDGVSVLLASQDSDNGIPATATVVSTDDGTLCAIDIRDQGDIVAPDPLFAEYANELADPICLIDADGRIERINDAMVEFTGYARKALLGRLLGELIPAATYERAKADVRALIDDSDRSTTTFEAPLVTADGQLKQTEVKFSVLTHDDGTYLGAVGVFRDVSDRTDREQDLELIKQVLSRLVRHNVRNELNLILGHGELLEATASDEQSRHVEKIVETTERLAEQSKKVRLIEQVIEGDQETAIELGAILDDVTAQYRTAFPEATIELDFETRPTVTAHPDIKTGIEELVDNAIRHAPAEARPWVSLRIEDHGRFVTLLVEDDSGGINDDELRVLRDGFESDLNHSSGVGLWLVRWLVEYSDATLVTHQTDQGSMMRIRFQKAAHSDAIGSRAQGLPVVEMPSTSVTGPPDNRSHGGTLVGRMDELHELERRYSAIETSGGQAVFVTGQTGIGKTALVDEFTTRIAEYADPPFVGTGSCRPGQTPPYHAFRTALEGLPVQRGLDELTEALPTELDGEEDTEASARQALFAAIGSHLRDIALDHPIVVVLENLQWAGPETVALLDHLLTEVGRWATPILFVGTVRTDRGDERGPVNDLLDDELRAHRLELDPLSRPEVGNILGYHLETESVPDSLVDAVYDQTEGIPLFVAEIGQQLRESADLDPTSDTLSPDAAELALPDSVERVVLDRVEGLSDEATSVLELCAVAGETASLSVIHEAAALVADQLESCVDELVRARLLCRQNGAVSFVHGVVRETAQSRIDADRRSSIHERLAAAIETVHEDALEEQYARLAHHYDEAGSRAAAREYYRLAGEQAAARHANDLAVEQFERAVALCDDDVSAVECSSLRAALAGAYRAVGALDDAAEAATAGLEAAPADSLEQCRLLDQLATVRTGQAAYDEAAELTERQRALAAELDDRELEAGAIRRLGSLARHRGAYDTSEQHYQTVLDIANATDNRRLKSRALKGLAAVNHSTGSYDLAFEYSMQGLELAREIGDRHHQARALTTLGAICSSRGDYDQATTFYEEGLAIKQELGNKHGEARTRSNLGLLAQRRGEYDRARAEYEESLEIARSNDDLKGEAYSLHNLGDVEQLQGRYEAAKRRFEQSLELTREIGDRRVQTANLVLLGDVLVRLERGEQAEHTYREGLDLATELGLPRWQANAHQGLGTLERQRDAYDAAVEQLEEALRLCEELGDRSGQAQVRLELGRTALARGDDDRADEAAVATRNTFEQLDARHWLARADRLLGRIDLHRHQTDTALDRLWSAVEEFEALSATDDGLVTIRAILTARAEIPDEQFDAAIARARSLSSSAPAAVRDRHSEWLAQYGALDTE